MAKKQSVATPAVTTEINRSQLIRDYHASNPNAGPSDIAKALSTDSMKISPALVGQVLNGRRTKNGGLSVETIKAAAAFVKGHKGKVEDAEAAIKSVGAFIDACGSADAALMALQSYRAVAEVVG